MVVVQVEPSSKSRHPPRLVEPSSESFRHDGKGNLVHAARATARVDYLDGFSRPLQTKALNSAEEWVASGLVVYDPRGLAVWTYEPYPSSTPDFDSDAALRASGVATAQAYDAAGWGI